MSIEDALNEEIGMLRADAATMAGEIERLSAELTKALAKIDELKALSDDLNRQYWEERTAHITAKTNLEMAQKEIKTLMGMLYDTSDERGE